MADDTFAPDPIQPKPLQRDVLILAWLAGLVLLGVLYVPTVSWVVGRWRGDEYYSHAPLIPLITAWLLWDRRSEIRAAWRTAQQPSRIPVLLLTALLLHLFGTLADMDILKALGAFSLPLVILGLARFLRGPALERLLRFPLLYLCLGVPVSGPLVELLTVPLQNRSASSAAFCLEWLGIPVRQAGVDLHTPVYSFTVAVPCSGLKTAITLLTMAILVAHLAPRLDFLRRILLAVLSLPAAFLANTVRVACIVLIGCNFGEKAADGFLHNFSGLVLFGAALALLFAFASLIASTAGSATALPATRNAPSDPGPTPGAVPVSKIILILALMLMTWLSERYFIATDPTPRGKPIGAAIALPPAVGDWTGKAVKVDPVVYEVLHPDAVVEALYYPGAVSRSTQPEGAAAEVTVIYSHNPEGLHSPVVCYRAQGWTISGDEASIVRSGDRAIELHLLKGEKDGESLRLAYRFSDAAGTVNGRLATFARLAANRFFHRATNAGAVEIMFGYNPACTQEDGTFTPEFSQFIIDVEAAVRRQMIVQAPKR